MVTTVNGAAWEAAGTATKQPAANATATAGDRHPRNLIHLVTGRPPASAEGYWASQRRPDRSWLGSLPNQSCAVKACWRERRGIPGLGGRCRWLWLGHV